MLTLVDFKLEFGTHNGEYCLAMKFLLIHAVFGMQQQVKNLIKTVSVATLAISKKAYKEMLFRLTGERA